MTPRIEPFICVYVRDGIQWIFIIDLVNDVEVLENDTNGVTGLLSKLLDNPSARSDRWRGSVIDLERVAQK